MFRFVLISVLAIACVDAPSDPTLILDSEVPAVDTGVVSDTAWRPKVEQAQGRWAPRPQPSPVSRPEPAAIMPLHHESGGAPGIQRIAVPQHPSTTWDLGLCIDHPPAGGGQVDCGQVMVDVPSGTKPGATVWGTGDGPLPEQFECAPAAWLSADPTCPHWLDMR